jgi:hypothetical protein
MSKVCPTNAGKVTHFAASVPGAPSDDGPYKFTGRRDPTYTTKEQGSLYGPTRSSEAEEDQAIARRYSLSWPR